jgi:hypothetical protein
MPQPPIKYSFELLDSFCVKNNVKLAHDYSEEKLFGSTKIMFHCTKCDKVNVKCFTYLIKRNTLCKHCVTIESLPKMKATMLEKYGVEHPSQSQEIKDKIVNGYIAKYGVTNPSKLQEVKDKQKKTNLERYGVKYIVHNESSKEKMIKTNLEKYGYACCLQNKEVREAVKNTNLKKYGVVNPSEHPYNKEKIKKGVFMKYGVEFPLQNKQSMEKMKKTNLEKYGSAYCLQNEEIKQTAKNTMVMRYGVEHSLQNKIFMEKMKKTCLEKYGTENPMQNKEVADKSFKSCFRKKTYVYPSGKEIECQGYEPFALDEIIQTINEDDIITGCKNVPTIWYYDTNGKEHRHYVDIFIPNQNKCIEVKSTWTLKKTKSNIFEKQEAGKKLGYEYEIWVYNAKGDKVETYA